MERKEIIEKINSFPRWHYQFNLDGHLTPIVNTNKKNRHLQRKKYFFDPLVNLLGGTLKGRRVLDLGCNAGFWSLHAIDKGADFVLGIDGRQMHIDQANFVFDVNHIKKHRYKFAMSNIFNLDFKQFGTFDIVLCLGLLYHINKPIRLIEKISEVNNDILVIDTKVLSDKGSHLQICHESLDDPRRSVDYELVLIPTKKAIFDIVQQFGYSIVMLKPQFQSYSGANAYKKGTRRAFLCAKNTNLLNLPEKVEPLDSHTHSPNLNRWLKNFRIF